jgi:hypothetical protein
MHTKSTFLIILFEKLTNFKIGCIRTRYFTLEFGDVPFEFDGKKNDKK